MENEYEINEGMHRDLARKMEGRRLGCLKCCDYKRRGKARDLKGFSNWWRGYLKSLKPAATTVLLTVAGNLSDVAWDWMPAIVDMSNHYSEGSF